MADLRREQGDSGGALAAYEEMQGTPARANISPTSEITNVTIGAIVRQLSGAELRSGQCKGDLIFSLDQLCSVKLRVGDIPGALAFYEELVWLDD